jgi:hypothetical protein
MGMTWEVISSGSWIFFSGKTILRQNQSKLANDAEHERTVS